MDIVKIPTVVVVVFVSRVGCGVYYSLDLLLSKLSIAQSSGKFREQHTYCKFMVCTAVLISLAF